MSGIFIRLATKDDADAIVAMLSKLVDEIGNDHDFLSTPDAIIQYGFSEQPLFHCFLAERAEADLGLALFFPIFSTNRGKPGIYVQDLWVSDDARGHGLGRKLLAETVNYGETRWSATYLSLMVYSDNLKAQAFYRKLGFDSNNDDIPMALDGAAFAELRNGK